MYGKKEGKCIFFSREWLAAAAGQGRRERGRGRRQRMCAAAAAAAAAAGDSLIPKLKIWESAARA